MIATELANPILTVLPKLPGFVWALLLGLVVITFLKLALAQALRVVRLQDGMRQLILAIANGLLWFFLVISLLQELGLSHLALALSGSFAFLSVALGTGATSLVSDLIAGFHLAKDRHFKVGDTVRIGETEGEIEQIGLRKVLIRDSKKRLHILPTADIDKREWVLIKQSE